MHRNLITRQVFASQEIPEPKSYFGATYKCSLVAKRDGFGKQLQSHLPQRKTRLPETINGGAIPEWGTAYLLIEPRMVCISDRQAPRTERSLQRVSVRSAFDRFEE